MTLKQTLQSILLSTTLMACGGGGGSDTSSNTSPDNTPDNSQSQVAQDYVAEVLALMQQHALPRYDIDWGNLEMEVNSLAADAQSISETYPALNKAFELLGTNHSKIVLNGTTVSGHSLLSCREPFDMPAQAPELADIGYVRVDGFSSSSDESMRNFAISIQNQIAEQDSDAITGWVVELRNNSGGNMYPMIAGLGPILGEGVHGYFIDADEQLSQWGYEDGSAFIGNDATVTIEEPYQLINEFPKVAVLSSFRTASSGEASLIAFKKLDNSRSFGSSSCGLSTSNQVYGLSDGSILVLTTGIMADREQYRYGNRVPVDEAVSHDEVLERAIEWIRE